MLFAGLYHLVLVGPARRRRARPRTTRCRTRIKEVEERARTFRLVCSGTQDSFPGVKDQEKWLVASVKEIEGAMGSALEIAETALRTHTVRRFLLTSDDALAQAARLPLARPTGCSASASPRARASSAALLKRRLPVRMNSPGGLKGVTYYERRRAAAVGGAARCPSSRAAGWCAACWWPTGCEHAPFTDDDERLLATIAGEVLRAIEVERVMTLHPQAPATRRTGSSAPSRSSTAPARPSRSSSRCWRARGRSPASTSAR